MGKNAAKYCRVTPHSECRYNGAKTSCTALLVKHPPHGDVRLFVWLSVCWFVRSSVASVAYRPSPRVSQMFSAPWKTSHPWRNIPHEIYVCGGGLLVASMKAPHLLQLFSLYCCHVIGSLSAYNKLVAGNIKCMKVFWYFQT